MTFAALQSIAKELPLEEQIEEMRRQNASGANIVAQIALRGNGIGEVARRPASSAWIVATAGIGVWGWIRPSFALALDVEALVALTQPRFRLELPDFEWTAPPAGVRAIFGPVVRLP